MRDCISTVQSLLLKAELKPIGLCWPSPVTPLALLRSLAQSPMHSIQTSDMSIYTACDLSLTRLSLRTSRSLVLCELHSIPFERQALYNIEIAKEGRNICQATSYYCNIALAPIQSGPGLYNQAGKFVAQNERINRGPLQMTAIQPITLIFHQQFQYLFQQSCVSLSSLSLSHFLQQPMEQYALNRAQ